MAEIEFDPDHSPGIQATVVSFDLCGFSDFCNHPDAHPFLQKFVSAVFDELNGFYLHRLEDGVWKVVDSDGDRIRVPDFMKYTGDGALLIWLLPDDMLRRQQCCTAVAAQFFFL